MKYILAHDLGTSGNKAVLYNQNGVLKADHKFNYITSHPASHLAEQDPNDWWKAVCECTTQLIEKTKIKNTDISAVSFCGHMNCMLPIDKDGRNLTNALIWSDQRSVKEIETINNAIGKEDIYRITGHRLNPSYVAAKIVWFKNNHPDLYKQTSKILQAKDFLVYKLTNNFCTDFSEASHLGILDIQKKKWSKEILNELKIDSSLLSPPHPSTHMAGKVTKEASSLSGLAEGTPVIIGGGDGCCSASGAGIYKPGSFYNVIGTSSWIAFLKEEPLFDSQMRTFNFIHLDGKNYMPCGTMQSAGSSLSWVMDNLLEQGSNQKDIDSFYTQLNEELQSVEPGANNLIFLPYLLGERTPWWNSNAKGAFIGLSPVHRKNEIIRSVLEGVGYNLKIILDIFSNETSIDKLIIIGGGARNKLWIHILADIWQKTIEVPQYLEQATSIGAAICAGVGIGLFKDFSVANKFNPVKEVVKPNKSNSTKYYKLYEIFKRSYVQLETIFNDLSNI